MNLFSHTKPGFIFAIHAGLIFLFTFFSIPSAQLLDEFIDSDKKYLGTTAVPFLSLPISARGSAMGTASTVLIEDASGIFWNPASLGLLRKHEFCFSHSEMPLGVRNDFLCGSLARDYLGTFAFWAQMFSAGSFSDSRDINEVAVDPTLRDFAFGAAYGGAAIPERLYGGVGIKVFQSQIEQERASGVAGDVFGMVLPGKGFRFALGLKNVGPAIRYGSEDEKIPTGVVAGIGQTLLAQKQLRWGLGFAKNLGELPTTSAGIEYVLPYKMTLRSGYTLELSDSIKLDGPKGLSLGFGFSQGRYSFDYTWAGGPSDLGHSHYLSVTALFKEILPKTGEDYYLIALKHFEKGNYPRCIEEAENALKMNPNLWKAHSLISRAYSMMRKFSGIEIALIYTGNTNGQIIGSRTGNIMTGGIARRASVIKNLSAQNPYRLIMDAGNLFEPKTEAIKIQALLEASSKMGYTLLGTGLGEIANDLSLAGIMADSFGLTYVASNLIGAKQTPSFVEEKMVDIKDKYKIYVVNLIGEQYANKNINPNFQIKPALDILKEKIKKNGRDADLRVAFVSDDDNGARYLAQMVPDLEVIICGSSGKTYAQPVVIGKTLILSPGVNGHFVGYLTIQFSEEKKMLSYQHRLIRLGEEIPEDQEVDDLMNQMLIKTQIEKEEPDLDFKRGKMSGKFLFVTNRTGKQQIYLKMLKNNMEYRLTGGKDSHFAPVFCPAIGKVGYLREWTDTLKNKTYNDLWTMELSGAKKSQITLRENVKSIAWHPSGIALYFCSDSAGNTEIYKTGSMGGRRENISKSPESNETEIAFSPLGKDLAFITDRDVHTQVYLTGVDGENPLRLTEDKFDHASPVFSPDGKYISYLSGKFGFGGKKDLVIRNLQTDNEKFLTQNTDVRSFTWTTDGNQIIFEAGVNLTDLNRVQISDGAVTKLLPYESIKTYSEQSPAILWFENTEWIIYQQAQKEKTTIWRVRMDGQKDQACAESNPSNFLK